MKKKTMCSPIPDKSTGGEEGRRRRAGQGRGGQLAASSMQQNAAACPDPSWQASSFPFLFPFSIGNCKAPHAALHAGRPCRHASRPPILILS